MDNQQIKNFIEQSRQTGISDDKIVSYLQSKGVSLQEPQEAPKSFGQKALETTKAFTGGVASGVGGIALTAEDYLARKGVFGEKVKTAMQGQPSLQQQFKTEMGGDESPTAFGIGQVGGEIASLATPVGVVGKAVGTGAKTLGAGKNVAKLAQAGAEGIAFTAGQSLAEGEKMGLKDYAINAGLNILIPAGGIVAKKAGENLPSRIVNSLIKPLQKDFAYGKNPGKVIAEKGIIANNFEELITKVKQAKEETGNTIGELRTKSTTPITLDAESVIAPIDQAIAKANLTPRTNAALIQRLEAVREDILGNLDNGLPPEKVKSLVGDLTKWTGNATDDQLVNKSLKGVYGSINSQMDDALKAGLSPEDFVTYKKANEQYGDLIAAENASVYRDKILERQDLISFGAKNAGVLTALGSMAMYGVSPVTALAGLAGVVIDKTMATPAFKTRLAALLSKLAPAEVSTFFDKVPTAKTLFKEGEINNLINKVKSTPNKQGGFAKFPYEGSKPKATMESLTTNANKTANSTVISKLSPKSTAKSIAGEDDILRELDQFDPSAIKTNKGLAFGSVDDNFRLDQLKTKMNTKALTPAEIKEADMLLKKVGGSSSLKGKGVIPETNLINEAKKYKSAEEFVKAQGTPVYHGTSKEALSLIEKGGFKKGKAGDWGAGIYTTKNKTSADMYGDTFGGKTIEAFIPENKIYEYKDFFLNKDKASLDLAKKIIANKNVPETLKSMNVQELADRIKTTFSTENPAFWLEKAGYKGIKDSDRIVSQIKDEIMIFSPEAIKTKSQLEELWKKANNKK